MNKTEICDLLVKQGIIEGDNRGYVIPGEYHRFVTAHVIASDPRVAIAVMEKLDSIYPEKLVDESWQVQASINAMPTEWIVNDNLSAAIIEACVEALT